MSSGFRSVLIWFAGSVAAVLAALAMLPTSLVDGHYLPVGHDSFYHARRILDTVLQPGGFYEFDPKMHFPEGDWITWPWGYDFLMAQAVRGLMAITGAHDPMKVLVHLPPMFLLLGVALVLGIAAAVRLPPFLRVVAVLCFAVSPQTQILFGVGAIDHHWAEQLFAFGMVLGGLRWLERPESAPRAALLGALLGAAVAFQAGLFMLQLPVLIGLAILWLRRDVPPVRSAVIFGATLVATTLLASLPSAPFRMGWFQLYYLSWFQLYIAACTATFAVALCRWRYRPKVLLALAVLAIALLVPVLAQVRFTGAFLSGSLAAVQQIDEIRSPFAVAMDGRDGLWRIALVYTLLLFAAPLTLAGCLVSLARERRREMVFFWAVSAFGLVFVLLQQRLHGFGSFALYLPWLVWAHALPERRPERHGAVLAAVAVVVAIAYLPSIRYQLFRYQPPAMDDRYASARPIFPLLAQACSERPGLVVADANDGHLIRYFTDCAVIGNNFRLTPADIAKFDESERLLRLPLEQVLREQPATRYILARITAPDEDSPARQGLSDAQVVAWLVQANPPLFSALMLQNHTEPRVQAMASVNARFAETHVVEHVTLFRVADGGAESVSP